VSVSPIDWSGIERVLVVRLRSIGDTVLTTPSLIALREFLPQARIDILLEDWVAPVLEGFDAIDNVLTLGESNASRFATARELRGRNYDLILNLHGGTTATFLTFASGAAHRVGFKHYRYSFLHNHLVGSSADFWQRGRVHSAEQQMALLGSVGIPVRSDQKTRLNVTSNARRAIDSRLADVGQRIALLHPAAAFSTKQWDTQHFARVAEFLRERGFDVVAVAAKEERVVLDRLTAEAKVGLTTFDDLSLPEITALADRASVFVGNDSGIAHISAAVGTPTVVVFGSSNRDHWRPWTDAPNEIVFSELACQPCPGHSCAVFGEPRCILGVTVASVTAAIDRVLMSSTS
jgi:lipopolysaccharide heptosyltransferase II